ncbi:MAG: signal peptidase I [Pseudobdellovibrio sp.]
MAIFKKKIGKQGTWFSAASLLLLPLLVLSVFRWVIFEPFVIPSGSMEPNLLVHDHIFVNKHSYGIRSPIGDAWLLKFSPPQRGDIVVFKYPENQKVFFIKRLIGLPGDVVKVQNGQITINDKPWVITPVSGDENNVQEGFNFFIESVAESNNEHLVKYFSNQLHVDPTMRTINVPAHSYFMMGDNRDQSHDSRFWGFVDESLLIGKASVIWLSCEKTLETAPMICDPTQMRLERLFKKVQ